MVSKKYATRPSPPYPANDWCGAKKLGNDKQLYVSTPNKNGVCRWVKVAKATSSATATSSAPKPTKKSSDPFYHVSVKLVANNRRVSKAKLAAHLARYVSDLSELRLLVDYNDNSCMQHVKLSGTTLSFDVPKSIRTSLEFLKTGRDLKRHILTASLADSSWESSYNNFFLMVDESTQQEISTIQPGEVQVK